MTMPDPCRRACSALLTALLAAACLFGADDAVPSVPPVASPAVTASQTAEIARLQAALTAQQQLDALQQTLRQQQDLLQQVLGATPNRPLQGSPGQRSNPGDVASLAP